MKKQVETGALFKPNPSRQESKAQITDHVARAIVDDEAKTREAKTAKLRQLRLQQEADATAPIRKKPVRRSAAKARAAG